MYMQDFMALLADDIKAHHFDINADDIKNYDTKLRDLGVDSLGVLEASLRYSDRFAVPNLQLSGDDTLNDIAAKIIAYKGDGFVTIPTTDDINAEIQDVLDKQAAERDYQDGLEDTTSNVVPIR